MGGCRYIATWGLLLLGGSFLLCSCRSTRLFSGPGPAAPSADSLFMLGQQMKLRQEPAKAIAYFKIVQQRRPQNATVYYEMARQYNVLHQADSVLYYARIATQLDSTNKWFRQFYARTLGHQKQFDQAATLFQGLAEDYPYQPDFVFQEALMLYYAERYREALPLLDSLEQSEGVSEALVYQKQLIYVRLKQIDSAALEIQKLIDQSPDNDRYYALLAKVYADNAQPQSAVDVYQNLLHKQPDNPQAQLALGILYKQMHKRKQFEQYTQQAFSNPAFSLEKKIRFIYPFLQYVEIDSTERTDALWLCHLLIRLHGREARAHALYGDMYFRCEEPDSALQEYKTALQLDRSRYEVWNQIMLIYTRKGAVDSLMMYSGQAAQRFPDNAKARYFNGIALYLKGENQPAAKELEQALQIGIDNLALKQHVYQSLSSIYLKLNQFRTAARYHKLAESLKKKEKQQQTVHRSLKS